MKGSLSSRANITIAMLDSLSSNLECSDASAALSWTPNLHAHFSLWKEKRGPISPCMETFYSLTIADRHELVVIATAICQLDWHEKTVQKQLPKEEWLLQPCNLRI
jgi:hypothetical protein